MGKENAMPWYWILVILSVIIAPFDALYLYNKMLKRREKRAEKERDENGGGE